MGKILKYIERAIQIIAVISSIFAAVQMVKVHLHKKRLKEKADEYIEDELALEGNMIGPVRVFSDDLKSEQTKARKLVILAGISILISMFLKLVNCEQYE